MAAWASRAKSDASHRAPAMLQVRDRVAGRVRDVRAATEVGIVNARIGNVQVSIGP
jgi:hypothetical protein